MALFAVRPGEVVSTEFAAIVLVIASYEQHFFILGSAGLQVVDVITQRRCTQKARSSVTAFCRELAIADLFLKEQRRTSELCDAD